MWVLPERGARAGALAAHSGQPQGLERGFQRFPRGFHGLVQVKPGSGPNRSIGDGKRNSAAADTDQKNGSLAVTYRPLSDLIPYARNARTHSEEQVAQIAASIKEFGFTNPILLDGDNGIIAGHGRARWRRRQLGLEKVPCIELGHLTEAQKRAYIIADNKLALNAGWDEELLRLELTRPEGAGSRSRPYRLRPDGTRRHHAREGRRAEGVRRVGRGRRPAGDLPEMRTLLSKIEDYPAHLEACWQEHLKPREPDAPTVISLFAGCGGSSLGYSMAGYRELLAVEWDEHAVETFKLNFPDVPVWQGDIADLSVEECLRITGLQAGRTRRAGRLAALPGILDGGKAQDGRRQQPAVSRNMSGCSAACGRRSW